MGNFVEISSDSIFKAVYEGCRQANAFLPAEIYSDLKKLASAGLENEQKMTKIFSNAYIAGQNMRPLCQDTGQVVVFCYVGKNVILDDLPQNIINSAIETCYRDNFLRKSVVKDAVFDRKNTNTNTPAVIYTELTDDDEIRLDILLKGGGAENMSALKMFNPSASEREIFDFVLETVKNAGENACPPLFLGIGAGGTADYAAILSKKAFFKNENDEFTSRLKNYINKNSSAKAAGVSIMTAQTHIACLPVFVTVNCHSNRHVSVLVKNDGYKILTDFAKPETCEYKNDNLKEIFVEDKNAFSKLKTGEEILLSGTIYTARDMAHARLAGIIEKGGDLPFDLKNAIIFYAGPCPKNETEIIGPVGPTTSKRMDKFAPVLYDNGVLASIGKGGRSEEVKKSVEKNGAFYFTVQGGVAALLQSCIKSAEIAAFEDLGTEAVFKLEVEKLPVKLEIGGRNE